ncbi:hypothetical protein D3C86_1637010 [compost metagenome]
MRLVACINMPVTCRSTSLGLTTKPQSKTPNNSTTRTSPVCTLTSTSATAAPYETKWVPSPTPRPLRTFTPGCGGACLAVVQPDALSTAFRTPSQRSSRVLRRRNSKASTPASRANSSTACSDANEIARSTGERNGLPRRKPALAQTWWLVSKRLGTSYIDPAFTRFTRREMPLGGLGGSVPSASSSVISMPIHPCCQPSYAYPVIRPFRSADSWTVAVCPGP